MIEKYIQFAIDNGFYKLENFIIENYKNQNTPTKNFLGQFIVYDTKYEIEWWNPWSNASGIKEIEVDEYVDIIRLITSKPFIEAVARGNEKEWIILDCPLMWWEWNIENSFDASLIEELSFMLISAIMKGELEEFIEKILPKK